MKFSVFQISRKGGREKNEDRMGYCYTSKSGLFMLADGMGGHPEGEVAAQIALQTISALYQKEAQPRLPDVKGFLNVAVMAAHQRIMRYAASRSMPDTPRTTLVAAVIQDGFAQWVHCGDSRLYFVRNGLALARTRDHSYLEQSRSSGRAAEPNAVVNRNVLYTCLGSPVRPVFDISEPVDLQLHDKMLLCSDGLWDNLSDQDIVQQLSLRPVSEAAPDLVDRALVNGGPGSDNVTVVAMEWETPDASEFARSSPVAEVDDAGFTSTVQAGDMPVPEDDFDDAAIERSIEEINEAIRRTSLRKP